MEVDSSNHAVGGVLSQIFEAGKLHPVAYYSTALQAPQKQWSATTTEAFTLILAVRHWRVYLAGTSFVPNSDHNPLTHLRSQRDLRGKFRRWISELEEFYYSIQYITGRSNVKTDALSHNTAAFHSQPSSEFESNIYVMFTSNYTFLDQLKEEQTKDPCICSTKDAIHSGKKVTGDWLKRVQHKLRISDGVPNKSGRLVLLPALRKLIVAEYHNISLLGTDKIDAVLKERFYWPNIYQQVKTITAGRQTCQKTMCH